MHPLLEQHLRKLYGQSIPDDAQPLIRAINAAILEMDFRRSFNETALRLNNNELETSLAASAAELQAEQEKFRCLVEHLPAIVYVCDLGAACRCTYVSPQINSILGYEPADWLNDPNFWIQRVHAEDRANAQRDGVECPLTGKPLRTEYRMIARDGRIVWMRDEAIFITNELGKCVLQGVMYDITAAKQAEQRLLAEALRDSLTGLPNRALFLDRLARAMACRKRDSSRQFAVMFMDLDRFKVVNDSIGHAAGDQMLIEFAQRLQRGLRPGDTVARLGGDEFAILVEEIANIEHVSLIAERIHEELKKPFIIQGHEIFTSSSIGIALCTDDYTQPEDMLRDADTAMYRAKADGKARHQVFDAAMHSSVLKQLTLENDLRRAIDRREFVVFYQPIISLSTGRIEAAEALVRWKHPEKGFISPADFIPAAEETGLITQIGLQVMDDACRQTRRWHDHFPQDHISISVNLSPRQFKQKDLVEQTLGILNDAGLSPCHLKLEITETAIAEDQQAAVAMLCELKKHQIQVSVDDFGTGYSSLGHLHSFPIDTIKIDRTFVQKLTAGEGGEIVKTIIQLAHNLEMRVTAEGIETRGQLDALRDLNCESGQGYYFAKPLPADEFTELLKARKTWEPLRMAV